MLRKIGSQIIIDIIAESKRFTGTKGARKHYPCMWRSTPCLPACHSPHMPVMIGCVGRTSIMRGTKCRSYPIAVAAQSDGMWKRDLYASGCRSMVGEVRIDAKQKSHACMVTLSGLSWSLERWTAWRASQGTKMVVRTLW